MYIETTKCKCHKLENRRKLSFFQLFGIFCGQSELEYKTSFLLKLLIYLRLWAESRLEVWEGVWRPSWSWSCEFSSGNVFNGKKIQISFSLSYILFLIQTFPYLQTYNNLLKPKVMSNIVHTYLDYTVEYTEHCTTRLHCFCHRSKFHVLNFHKCRMEIWLCLCKANTCSLANGQYLYFITTDIEDRHKKCFFSIQPKEN